ncbi:MAG: hypothetical protein EBS03_04670 [Actinobacteria bacterium]|nr:hypothetical protein [Actinomycetota bacterium]
MSDWRIRKDRTVRRTSEPMMRTRKSTISTPKKLRPEKMWFMNKRLSFILMFEGVRTIALINHEKTLIKP